MIDEKPSTFCQTKIKNKKTILDWSKDCVPIGLYKENLELEMNILLIESIRGFVI